MSDPLLECVGVGKRFYTNSSVTAAHDVDLRINAGESVALVGESGSGKSTLMRLCLGLITPDSGTVKFLGKDWTTLGHRERQAQLSQIGAVFQEPFESLDPRQRVLDIVTEPMRLHERENRRFDFLERATSALAAVGLDESYLTRTPARLSGGQQQRVGIARAIVREPRLVLLDEPTSALDLSVQAQVLQIIATIRQSGVAIVTITHDLGVAAYLADWVIVMRHGKVVEQGPTLSVLDNPAENYTASLIAASALHLPERKSA